MMTTTTTTSDIDADILALQKTLNMDDDRPSLDINDAEDLFVEACRTGNANVARHMLEHPKRFPRLRADCRCGDALIRWVR
jgi:hypothetical protein